MEVVFRPKSSNCVGGSSRRHGEWSRVAQDASLRTDDYPGARLNKFRKVVLVTELKSTGEFSASIRVVGVLKILHE